MTLVVDDLKVRHAKCLGEWLEKRREDDGFVLEHLPNCSPELNSDGYLNRDVKAGLAEHALPKDAAAVERAVVSHHERRKGGGRSP